MRRARLTRNGVIVIHLSKAAVARLSRGYRGNRVWFGVISRQLDHRVLVGSHSFQAAEVTVRMVWVKVRYAVRSHIPGTVLVVAVVQRHRD